MEIHQSLKQCRLRRGLTQEQAAEQLHTTRQTISSYETGRTQPDLDALTRLAGLYGVSVERLLYGDREETGRLRLRRAARIVLAVYLSCLLLCSAARWAVNRWTSIPGLTGGHSTTVTDELRPLLELHFALLDGLDAALGAVVLLFQVALLVLLFRDLSLGDPGPLRRRVFLFLILAVGSFAVTVPWGLFDPVSGTGSYRISAYSGLASALLILLIDLGVLAWRRWRARRSPV